MGRKCQELKGMNFRYIAESCEIPKGKELECFVAEISPEKGLTIKALDFDAAKALHYNMEIGTENAGNMTCINLIDYPSWRHYFDLYVEELFLIKDEKQDVFSIPALNKYTGDETNSLPCRMASCAF